jgi:excisionase family DNA binding protein
MARIFDVIEYASEMADEIVRRFPETGAGDFRIGSQVIVRESQRALFARDGKALDVFGPGRHTITTANIPLLIDFIGRAFNDRSPFTAEVYYVSVREFIDRKWGTPQPIVIMTPGMGLGVALIQGFGTYSFQVSDPQQFVTQVVGTQGVYRMRDIEDRLRTMLLSKLQDSITEIKFNTIPDLLSMTEELGAAIRAKGQDDFLALGVTLKSFYIGSLQPSERSIEELRSRGLLDLSTYTQLQAADAMRDAAQNPSGGAGLTAGIGAGMGIGNVLSQSLSGQVGAGAAAANQPAGGAAGAAAATMPDVMTPGEAAQFLKVSEEDVVAAIEAGDLKARKLGNAFRISKSALEEFLKG